MATVEKRPLTAEELADKDRLVAAWAAYKATHKGASQDWLGKATGLGSQGAISQYFRGIIPLNVRALLAICGQIGADPSKISPRLAKDIPVSPRPLDLSKASPAARDAIEAILIADMAGEPAETFRLIKRLLPEGQRLGRLESDKR